MTLLAGPSDLPTLRPIARHLRKTANYDFADVVLVLDTLPPHPAEKAEALLRAAAEMLVDGEVTRIVKLSANAQVGYYDLLLNDWCQFLHSNHVKSKC
jgi:hypothetical protein